MDLAEQYQSVVFVKIVPTDADIPTRGGHALGRAPETRFWESHSGESFNDRQQKVVNRLLDGFEGKLTSSKWAKLAGCSQDTAHRDIIELVLNQA